MKKKNNTIWILTRQILKNNTIWILANQILIKKTEKERKINSLKLLYLVLLRIRIRGRIRTKVVWIRNTATVDLQTVLWNVMSLQFEPATAPATYS